MKKAVFLKNRMICFSPVILIGVMAGLFAALYPDSIHILWVFAAVPVLLLMAYSKITVIDLIIICIPVMFYVSFGFEINISLADFLLPVALVCIIREISRDKIKGEREAYLLILGYGLVLMSAFSLSLINTFFSDTSNLPYGISNILKIVVNSVYALIFMFYFNQYDGFYVRFLKVWSLTAVIVSILCIIGVLAYAVGLKTSLAFYNRASGTLQDSNFAACYLNISLGIVLIYNLQAHKKLVRYNTLLVLSALFLTASRGGIFGLATGLICIILFNLQSRISKSLIKVIAVFALFIFAAGITSIGSNIIESVDHRILATNMSDYNTVTRLTLWKTAINAGISRPIAGIGTGQFVPVMSMLNSSIENIPHNTYLGLFAETGIIGFLALLWFPVVLFTRLRLKARNGSSVAILSTLVLISVGVQAFTINIENFRPLWIFISFALFYCNRHACEIDNNLIK